MVTTHAFLALLQGSPRLATIDLGNGYKMANDVLLALTKRVNQQQLISSSAMPNKLSVNDLGIKATSGDCDGTTDATELDLSLSVPLLPLGLSKLSLCNCKLIDNEGFAMLALISSLRSLDLSRCPKFLPSDAVIKIVRRCGGIASLFFLLPFLFLFLLLFFPALSVAGFFFDVYFHANRSMTEVDLSENVKLPSPFLSDIVLQMTDCLVQLSLDQCVFV
jgi:hypothetical protein